MQNKYGKDGLEVVSVALDYPEEKDARGNLLKFLQQKKFPFMTVNVDPKTIDKKSQLREYTVHGVPVVYVFNRDNLYVKKLPLMDAKEERTEDVEYDVVEKAVEKLMKK